MTKILILAILGFFLFLAGCIFSERREKGKWLSNVVVLLILIGYFYYLPHQMKDFQDIHGIRTFLLAVVSILAIMVAPYIKKNETMGFWQYNKKLFLRLVFTAISTGTLFLGIAATLASFNYLFGAHIDEKWYLRVWIMVVGLISTTVFSLGIPRDWKNLEEEVDYPRVVKIFTQFVLLPLLGLYTIILYLYGGKIFILGQWPKGLVSILVLIFASVGIVANLLLYPERERNVWVKKLSIAFWALMLPLLGLLYGAIHIRLTEYGLTHERLFVIILGLWLLGLSLYFIGGKKQDIKMIFVSLIFLIVITVFGPINVFSLSRNSQTGRLQSILVENKILVNGKIQKVDKKTVSEKDTRQIISIVNYLNSVDGMNVVRKWLDGNVNIGDNPHENARSLLESMGLEYANYSSLDETEGGIERKVFNSATDDYAISSYHYLHKFDLSSGDTKDSTDKLNFSVDSLSGLFLELNDHSLVLKQRISDQEVKDISTIELDETINNLVEGTSRSYYDNLPVEKMTVETKNSFGPIKIYLDSLSLEGKDGNWKITNAQGLILF